ncbi:DUF1707 SHOCT-like domain-containing protein [Nonomuraea roseoviolacea]|uniref:DUF1707 domain-containing protein n=1 Tax=Nonomuraea roseoviolacea subsp. carminata TaxID=160689 RepID=A0ABT1K4R5_9ACTN|nr:DUF1707 domain-containing protein [Nonomuraea roseoviolacea]MCP2349005.1 hypothetical protein [Nonomuraea roseoviolacea subsp. carminata]
MDERREAWTSDGDHERGLRTSDGDRERGVRSSDGGRERGVRASDGDREAAAERLRVAVEEGCLDLGEFDERIGLAYQSVTRGDLAELLADLPDASASTSASVPAPAGRPPGRAPLPTLLKVLWGIWSVALVVSVVSWVVEAVSDPCPVDFSPGGLVGPGIVLLIATVVTRRRATPPQTG